MILASIRKVIKCLLITIIFMRLKVESAGASRLFKAHILTAQDPHKDPLQSTVLGLELRISEMSRKYKDAPKALQVEEMIAHIKMILSDKALCLKSDPSQAF